MYSLDWVRNPFGLSVFELLELTAPEEDKLTNIRNDRRPTLKRSSAERPNSGFLTYRSTPHHKNGDSITPSYLYIVCEPGFSAMKNKNRSWLQTLERTLRLTCQSSFL
jgi:hypothetical protein